MNAERSFCSGKYVIVNYRRQSVYFFHQELLIEELYLELGLCYFFFFFAVYMPENREHSIKI